MARVTRSRSRTLRGSISGSVIRTPFAQYTTTTTPLGVEYCDDSVGAPWLDSQFDHRKGIVPEITLNGTRSQSGIIYVSTDLPLNPVPYDYMRRPWLYGSFERTAIPGLAAMAVANANPNRPDIDLPVSILELRELPSLLRDASGIMAGAMTPAKGSAKANLALQFGLLPIANDVATLFDFAKKVNAREKYLRELSSGKKRIKRNLAVEEWDHAVNDLLAFHTNADNFVSSNKVHIRGKMKRRYWYTMRASLLDVLPEREIRSLAPQLVLGTNTISASQLWNLVPWTWLIDWFTTTGDLLAAYRGGLKWQWSNLNIMYQTDYYMTALFPNPRSGFTYTPQNPNSHATRKIRVQPAVLTYPQWRIPYLTGRQMSILSSLAILRI
jgi:hypothetical protein